MRYPNFAARARESTWYRNTTSVHADTHYAVPAILDARMPRPHRLPVVRDHPRSLFALLAGRGPLLVRGGPSKPGRNVRVLTKAGGGAITDPRGASPAGAVEPCWLRSASSPLDGCRIARHCG